MLASKIYILSEIVRPWKNIYLDIWIGKYAFQYVCIQLFVYIILDRHPYIYSVLYDNKH